MIVQESHPAERCSFRKAFGVPLVSAPADASPARADSGPRPHGHARRIAFSESLRRGRGPAAAPHRAEPELRRRHRNRRRPTNHDTHRACREWETVPDYSISVQALVTPVIVRYARGTAVSLPFARFSTLYTRGSR